ncbi:hypothetical protein COSO111634_18045 [Corallococcus soli]
MRQRPAQPVEQRPVFARAGEGLQPLRRGREQQARQGPVLVQLLRHHREPEVPVRARALRILVLRGRRDAVAHVEQRPRTALPGERGHGLARRGQRHGRAGLLRHQGAQAAQRGERHLRGVSVPLEGDGAQAGAAREHVGQQLEQLLAHGLRVVVHVEGPGPPARHHASRDVDLHHLLQREAVQPRAQRQARGELVAEEVPQVQEQRQARARVQLRHEVQRVQPPSRGEHRGVLHHQRDAQARLDVERVRRAVAHARFVERRRHVQVARKGLAARVPPADVVAHPRTAHGLRVRVQVRERGRGLQIRPVEVQVHRVEEHGHVRAPAPHLREERGLGLCLLQRDGRAVLHEVEEPRGRVQQPVRMRHVRSAQVAAQSQPHPGQRPRFRCRARHGHTLTSPGPAWR